MVADLLGSCSFTIRQLVPASPPEQDIDMYSTLYSTHCTLYQGVGKKLYTVHLYCEGLVINTSSIYSSDICNPSDDSGMKTLL